MLYEETDAYIEWKTLVSQKHNYDLGITSDQIELERRDRAVQHQSILNSKVNAFVNKDFETLHYLKKRSKLSIIAILILLRRRISFFFLTFALDDLELQKTLNEVTDKRINRVEDIQTELI